MAKLEWYDFSKKKQTNLKILKKIPSDSLPLIWGTHHISGTVIN